MSFLAIPRSIWMLGFVRLCMDVSSEVIYSLRRNGRHVLRQRRVLVACFHDAGAEKDRAIITLGIRRERDRESTHHRDRAMRVLDYLLRHRPEAQTLEQPFPPVTDYYQIGLILALGMADNLLGRVPDSDFDV